MSPASVTLSLPSCSSKQRCPESLMPMTGTVWHGSLPVTCGLLMLCKTFHKCQIHALLQASGAAFSHGSLILCLCRRQMDSLKDKMNAAALAGQSQGPGKRIAAENNREYILQKTPIKPEGLVRLGGTPWRCTRRHSSARPASCLAGTVIGGMLACQQPGGSLLASIKASRHPSGSVIAWLSPATGAAAAAAVSASNLAFADGGLFGRLQAQQNFPRLALQLVLKP